jgi:type IV secretory pathway VirB10-like protein
VLINGVLQGGTVAITQEALDAGAPGAVAASIAQGTAQVGQQRTGRALNTSPIIRVPRGARMTLILGKDLWVKAPHSS